jgi:hypothetical protein
MSIVNIGFNIWNFELACVIAIGNFRLASDSFRGFLPFVSFDDIFRCCGWLLPRTFFVTFAYGWLGVGSGVLRVRGGDWCSCSSSGDFCGNSRIGDGCGWSRIGDFCGFSIIGGNCSRIGDRTSCSRFGDGGRRASGDIEAREVDAEAAAAAGSISIVLRLHWTLLATASHIVSVVCYSPNCYRSEQAGKGVGIRSWMLDDTISPTIKLRWYKRARGGLLCYSPTFPLLRASHGRTLGPYAYSIKQ